MHLQPFIGYSKFITNHLVSLYKYECGIINCYNNNNNNNNKLLYSHISKKHIDSTTVKHK